MNQKVNVKDIDERIRQAFQQQEPELIEDLIDVSTFEGTQLWNYLKHDRELSAGFLQDILIARDKKALGLKKQEISEANVEELELDEEFANYNAEMLEEGEATVIRGKDKDGKDNILYYYVDYENDWVTRQQRVFNEHGDIESMSRQTIFSDGRCEHIDDAVIVYQYDKHSNKKAALYQDDLTGMKYFEYDKSGNIVLKIEKDYIEQSFQENENTYTICDGYIKPFYNGFQSRNTTSISELKPKDMKRYAFGGISLETRNALMDSMDMKRKEEVLSTLSAVEPIFESCKTANILDEANIQKMQKLVQWFTSFEKRLEITPNSATQDVAVMSAMRSAVGKTVGNTRNAEKELKIPVKEEIKEKELGDN